MNPSDYEILLKDRKTAKELIPDACKRTPQLFPKGFEHFDKFSLFFLCASHIFLCGFES